MTDTLDMLLLLSQGKLPLSAVDPTQLPNALTAVYRAFEYILSKPHTFPLSMADVKRVATSRFHAKADALAVLTELLTHAPNSATTESVQQSILLRKIVAEASEQIASGKYNVPLIATFANHATSFGVSSLVRPISAPTSTSEGGAAYITGITVVDNAVKGIRDELVVVSARPKNGKALAVTTPVLTPTGWRQIGDMRAGDDVIGSNGQATMVTHVARWENRPVYKLVWADGASVLADSQHEWDVYRGGRAITRTRKTTAQLRSSHGAWSTPVPAAVDHPPTMLPIHPYVLGLLIGDGCLTEAGVRLSVMKPNIIDKVRAACVHSVKWSHGKMSLADGKRDMRRALQVLGLADKTSHTKFLPSAYMMAPASDRRLLLSGLMDSDGHVEAKGRAEYYTVSHNLALGVQRLVWSLGGESKVALKRQHGRTSYRVSVCLAQYRRAKTVSRQITSARYVGRQATACITVAAPDGLYVCKDYILTHNSNFMVNLVCLSPAKTFLYVTVADYGYDDLCQVMADCVPSVVKRTNVHIADFTSFGATVVDVETVIREVKPDIVIVDRAEKLVPLVKAREPRWELAKIFETLRQYAKRYHVPVFVDAQQSDAGSEWTRKTDQVSPDSMAEDKTGRFAMLDLFIGLQRKAHVVKLHIVGRRKSLPADVEVQTNAMGRYLA